MQQHSDGHAGAWVRACGLAVLACVLIAGAPGCRRQVQPPRSAEAARKMLHDAGERVYQLSYAQAEPLFDALLAGDAIPADVRRAATYGKAMCRWHAVPATADQVNQARELLEALAASDANGPYQVEALLSLARIAELRDYAGDAPDPAKAREYYRRVLENRPDHPRADEATLRLAMSHIQTYDDAQVTRGIEVLQSWLARRPGNPLASAMWEVLGNTYLYPRKDYRRAVDCLVHADEAGLTDPAQAPQLYWQIANLADTQLHDDALTVRYFTAMLNTARSTPHAGEAIAALHRLGAPVPASATLMEALSAPREDDANSADPEARP